MYLKTLAVTVTGEDSGELVAAASTLGIPHPTGYPLWCLLGFAFTKIIPIGDAAFRVNCMSAFFGAATVFLVILIVIRLTRSHLAGLGGGLSLAFSREFWEQSVIAEVYLLNAFFFAWCVLLLLAWRESRRDRLLLWFSLVYGLSLILAALYVYYRDLNQIWDVLLLAGFFLSPLVYPISIVPEKYLAYYMMNPVTVIIEMYRETLLYSETPSLGEVAFAIVAAIAMLLAGTALFRRLERRFAEEI